jgi:hypothetical protein
MFSNKVHSCLLGTGKFLLPLQRIPSSPWRDGDNLFLSSCVTNYWPSSYIKTHAQTISHLSACLALASRLELPRSTLLGNESQETQETYKSGKASGKWAAPIHASSHHSSSLALAHLIWVVLHAYQHVATVHSRFWIPQHSQPSVKSIESGLEIVTAMGISQFIIYPWDFLEKF